MTLTVKQKIVGAHRRNPERSYGDIARQYGVSRQYVHQTVKAAQGEAYEKPVATQSMPMCKTPGCTRRAVRRERESMRDARYCDRHRGKGYLRGRLPALLRSRECARCGKQTTNRTYCSTTCRNRSYSEAPLVTRGGVTL